MNGQQILNKMVGIEEKHRGDLDGEALTIGLLDMQALLLQAGGLTRLEKTYDEARIRYNGLLYIAQPYLKLGQLHELIE